ncbi:hypothetical protein HOD29_05920 [archaeon]|nr:hypothetical protein [archaeon]
MKKIFIFLMVVGLIGLTSASSVAVWQGQYYTGTTFNTGTYGFNFTIYDALIGGDVCFTNTTSLTTGNWGEWKTEQTPWTDCNNSSKEYFLNINIAGTDETPRRRLTVSDFLRKDVEVTKEGNLNVSDNISASFFIGDGSLLTGISGTENASWNESWADLKYSLISEPLWSANFTSYNSSWSSTFNSTYDAYNSTGLIRDWNLTGYIKDWNSTGLIANWSIDLSNYYLKLNSFGFWNDTYATFNKTYADSLYASIFVVDTDTQKTTQGPYLYNDSAIIYFNETILNATIDLRSTGGDNSTWNETLADTLYYGISNPFGFYNSTDFSITDYFTKVQIEGFSYYNSTDFSIGDYYLKSNPFSFWNDTYATFNKTYADNLYAAIGVGGDNSTWNESYANGKFLNLSGTNVNQDINVAPYNFEAANLTLTDKIIFALGDVIDNIVNTWIRVNGNFNITQGLVVGEYANVSGNITTEEIHFEQDTTNHRMYDNSTCVIITGDTSTMYIC